MIIIMHRTSDFFLFFFYKTEIFVCWITTGKYFVYFFPLNIQYSGKILSKGDVVFGFTLARNASIACLISPGLLPSTEFIALLQCSQNLVQSGKKRTRFLYLLFL